MSNKKRRLPYSTGCDRMTFPCRECGVPIYGELSAKFGPEWTTMWPVLCDLCEYRDSGIIRIGIRRRLIQ